MSLADNLFPTLREVRTPTATYCFDPGGLLVLGRISGTAPVAQLKLVESALVTRGSRKSIPLIEATFIT